MNLIIFLLAAVTTCLAQQAQEGKVVCYYANWSYLRKGLKFDINKINPSLCTHVVYAFLAVDEDKNGVKPSDIRYDIEQGGFKQFNQLKIANPKLKTMASLGGQLAGSEDFSTIAASSKRRSAFAKNVKRFLQKYGFDGISIDWRDPNNNGGRHEDYENYVRLMKEIRAEFDSGSPGNRSNLILALSIPAQENFIRDGYDLPNLAKYVDFITLLFFDYYLSTDPDVHHHSPLYPLPNTNKNSSEYKLNVNSTLRFVLDKGVPPNVLVLGIPAYGRSFSLLDEKNNTIGSPAADEGEAGNSTRAGEKGYLAYYELCARIKRENWTVVKVEPTAIGPYAYKRTYWIGYDDPDMARRKGAYAKENDLGGIMFWTIDNDDHTGECTGKGYPLINAAKDGYGMASGRPVSNRITAQPRTTRKPQRQSTAPRPIVKYADPPMISPLSARIQQPTTSKPLPEEPSFVIEGKKESGGNTYYQRIAVWITNNIFIFGDTKNLENLKEINLNQQPIPEFITNLFSNFP